MVMLTGTDLLAIREKLGLTRKEFADRVGVTVAGLCRWEKDERFPRREHMVELNKLADEAEYTTPIKPAKPKPRAASKAEPVPA